MLRAKASYSNKSVSKYQRTLQQPSQLPPNLQLKSFTTYPKTTKSVPLVNTYRTFHITPIHMDKDIKQTSDRTLNHPNYLNVEINPQLLLEDLPQHYDKAWAFYRSMNSPKYICAPMVAQSEYPFRVLARRYNCELGYSPMLVCLHSSSHLIDLFKSAMCIATVGYSTIIY